MKADTAMGSQEKQAHQEVVAGIDVGGTFTDLILIDSQQDSVKLAKTPTTTGNQAEGFISALKQAGADPGEIDLIVHGTTTTTNAVLERRLSKTGMITTTGFRDILELGRRTRPQAYGMYGEFKPIIARDLRREVPERMDASGEVVTALDEDRLRAEIKGLLEAGCESLLIHFLHAYANPAHELRAGEIAKELWPNQYITLGHSLLSESREFERGVTAAVNASVQPLLERYLARLHDDLSARGYSKDVLVMNGNGGMVSSRFVAQEAAKTVMSGPASGVMAAAYTGARAKRPNLITYDMGGTSSDVAMIRGAEPAVSNETEIEYAMPIHVPMVDVRTIGAGGGSIAWVDKGGLLQVGPHSAGADPGPICYGRGGQEPTISDANLLLGRLNPKKLTAVEGEASLETIARIFADKLGGPLNLSAEQAAQAVLKVANMKMAGAIRMVSISLGVDPRDFALFAFGGAGPLHATALARELSIPEVLVPCRPGITNALGCVVANLRHDFVRTLNRPLERLDIDVVHSVFAEQAEEGRRLIDQESVRIDEVREVYSADMQFIGQTHLLRVDLPGPKPSRDELQALFEETYWKRFAVALPEIKANLVNLNCSVIGVRPPLDLSRLIDPKGRKAKLEEAKLEERQVNFDDAWVSTPIYQRDLLPADAAFTGPAIVEQLDTTVVIEPGDRVTSDEDGNLIITLGQGA